MIDLAAMSQTQRVTYALVMGLIAPTEEKSRICCECADSFAVGLSDAQIKACKAAALQMAEGNIGGGI